MEITYDLYGVISVTRFAESPPCVPDDAESCCVLRRGGEAGPAREDCDWLKLNWSSSICSSCNKGPRVPVLGKGIEGRGRSVSSSNSSTMAARRDILFFVVVEIIVLWLSVVMILMSSELVPTRGELNSHEFEHQLDLERHSRTTSWTPGQAYHSCDINRQMLPDQCSLYSSSRVESCP